MLGFLWQKGNPVAGSELTQLLQRAQAGDESARESLVRRYADWALRVAATHCGRYVSAQTDDEASIALMAVDEAVLNYRSDSGSKFTSFLAMVIKRRLIDYYRRQSRQAELPLSAVSLSEQVPDEADEERQMSKEEIEAFVGELKRYGITLRQLVQASPKQSDARKRAMEAARTLMKEPELAAHFRERKELPLKQLASLVKVSRKTLERQRTYIVAMVIILSGDYGFLQSFLSGKMEGDTR